MTTFSLVLASATKRLASATGSSSAFVKHTCAYQLDVDFGVDFGADLILEKLLRRRSAIKASRSSIKPFKAEKTSVL
jgi:hypothetical protein